MKKQGKLTHKEAVKQALEELGGRARLRNIYPLVIQRVTYKPGSDIEATIRRQLLTTPELFRPVEGRKGWWELVSYQEEVAVLKQRIAYLSDINKKLEAIPKATDLIEKMLPEMMDVCKHDRMKADPLRIALRHLGYEEAAGVFDAWISEKEDDLVKAMEKLKIKIHNITMTGESATYIEL